MDPLCPRTKRRSQQVDGERGAFGWFLSSAGLSRSIVVVAFYVRIRDSLDDGSAFARFTILAKPKCCRVYYRLPRRLLSVLERYFDLARGRAGSFYLSLLCTGLSWKDRLLYHIGVPAPTLSVHLELLTKYTILQCGHVIFNLVHQNLKTLEKKNSTLITEIAKIYFISSKTCTSRGHVIKQLHFIQNTLCQDTKP